MSQPIGHGPVVENAQEGLLRPLVKGVFDKLLEHFIDPLIKVTSQGPMEWVLGVDEVVVVEAVGLKVGYPPPFLLFRMVHPSYPHWASMLGKGGASLKDSGFYFSTTKNVAPRWEDHGSYGECNEGFFG